MNLMNNFLSVTKKNGQNFPGAHVDDIPIFEDLIDRKIRLLYFFDEQSELFAELSRRSSSTRVYRASLLK